MLKTFFVKLLPDAKYDFYDPVKQGTPADDFNWSQYDLLMMDYDLGNGENGLDWLRKYKSGETFPATIMLTAHGNEEIAVEAMRFGAQDYINKTKLSLDRLGQAVNNAMEKRQKQDLLSSTLTLQSNIFNKVHFYKKIKEAIESQVEGKFSFLLHIQINKYKEIYEQHGLLLTDNYITHITTAIARLIRDEKLELNIVRMADAVICCLIHNCKDRKVGEKIAGLVSERIKQPYQSDDKAIIESPASIGVVLLEAGHSVDFVLDKSEKSCLTAMKNGVAIHASDDEQVISESAEGAPSAETEIVSVPEKVSIDLAEIIKRNSIQTYFQPYIALSDTAASFKASYFQMRMNIVLNDEKIFDSLEIKNMDVKNGNPGTLDLWSARFALAQLLNMKKENTPGNCGLFIRLSEDSLRSNKLYEWMDSLIKKTKVPNIASTLVFEIWPPDFLAHKDVALNLINKMRDTWGVGFAMFDVINTSVLKTCVKQAGFEFIKFTMDGDKTTMISEISEAARELGVLTVIDQISNAQQLNSVIEMGFDYGQGDFIQPPMDQLIMADVIEM
jgi:EAL domain-containing protein (putative c-di-GMP-specific phosphodiesterase class I)/DNA-binding response OmpR family regulator